MWPMSTITDLSSVNGLLRLSLHAAPVRLIVPERSCQMPQRADLCRTEGVLVFTATLLTGMFSPGCLLFARRLQAEGFPWCHRGRLRSDPELWSGPVAGRRSEEELHERNADKRANLKVEIFPWCHINNLHVVLYPSSEAEWMSWRQLTDNSVRLFLVFKTQI